MLLKEDGALNPRSIRQSMTTLLAFILAGRAPLERFHRVLNQTLAVELIGRREIAALVEKAKVRLRKPPIHSFSRLFEALLEQVLEFLGIVGLFVDLRQWRHDFGIHLA